MKWAIPEKKNWVENMEFPGEFKKKQVDFPGVNYQISRGDQEKIMRNFQGSWF